VSVQASTWVWEHSESAGNARLVLLAIADAADADGGNAWPTQARVAAMARVSTRTVRRLVSELIMLGELEMEEHAGGTAKTRDDRRPHLYRLPKMSTGGHQCPPVKDSDKRLTGGHGATNGRTRRDERADTAVPITSFIQNTQREEQENPSGGQTADAAAPSLGSPSIAKEEPVTPPAETLALFDPPPLKAKDAGKPKQPPSPSAGSVVAAFVDSYRKHHSGGDPVKSAIGRVARDAKMMIDEGRAAATELERAASEMGSGPYANLPVALDKLRQKPARRTAGVPARPHTDPHWQEVEQRTRREYRESLLTDDDMIRWTKRFPSEVDKVLTEWPELADRFRDVA
jgi:Helix-turn-helix domain